MNAVDTTACEALRDKAAALLSDGSVKMVIGYAPNSLGEPSPCFARSADETGQFIWDNACYHNLATYLTREHVQRYFPVALVVKGCDLRAVNMLIKEHVIKREDVILLGLPCGGQGDPPLAKCRHCDVQVPTGVDQVLPGEPAKGEAGEGGPFAGVEQVDALPVEDKWKYWRDHLSRCIRCYACRQVCPMCYCKRCIVEKTQPQWVEFSPHLRGNFAWNVIRGFHLTGRCVGCGECERVCPVGIPLGEINSKMAKVVKDRFDYEAGTDADTPSPFTTYDLGLDTDEGIL